MERAESEQRFFELDGEFMRARQINLVLQVLSLLF
jgi:hypothetical protein